MATIQGTAFYGPESPNGAKDGDVWRNQTTGELRYYAGGAWQPGDAVDTAPVVITGPTSPQLQVGYDASNYMTVAVASNGATTLNAVGAGQAFAFSDAVTITGGLTVATGGATVTGNVTLDAAGLLQWGSSGVATPDTILVRDAANTLAQRNGAAPQAFKIYSTYTSGTSYESAILGWTAAGGSFQITTSKGSGSGSARNIIFGTGDAYRWIITSSGHLIANDDNAYDIGASGATRPRNLYLAGTATIGSTITATGLSLSGAGPVILGTTAGGSISIQPNTGGFFVSNQAGTFNNVGVTDAGVVTVRSGLVITTGGATFTTSVSSVTALATPGAYAATTGTVFASTVSGATLMGFGTTGDVTLKNRAGTDVVVVTANTLNVTMAGALAISGALSGVTTLASGTHTVTGAVNASTGIAVGATYSSGNGVFVQNASTNNAISTASQGAATTTLYIGNTAITVVSDVRLKRDITPTTIDALDLIGRLKVVDYTWDDPSDAAPVNKNSRGRWTGLLAQDLIDVVPWVVNAEDRTCWECRSGLRCAKHRSFWHVDLDHMVPLLARGVQELTRRVTTLEHPGVYA